MAHLKYYVDEFKRYGTMGAATEAQMGAAMEAACEKFGMPRVKIVINPRLRTYSKYFAGLNMIAPCNRIAPAMKVPTIEMNTRHMSWQVFTHELAHHLHYTRYNAKMLAALAKVGITLDSTYSSRVEAGGWVRANFKKEHAHGPSHRVAMQDLVNFFMEAGFITTKPTYMQPEVETVGQLDPMPEALAPAAGK
jgi:hypothetical protein